MIRTRAQLIADGVLKPTNVKGKVEANVQCIIARRGESPRVRRALAILEAAGKREADERPMRDMAGGCSPSHVESGGTIHLAA